MSDSLFLPAASTCAATVALPGSKSISNRVLLLAALSALPCTIYRLLASDDTQRMLEALTALGIRTVTHDNGTLAVYGQGGCFPNPKARLFLGNAGTAFRPLTAVLAVLGGNYELSGVARMHERPIGDLVDALRQAGAQIDYLQSENFPPLAIGTFTDNGQRSVHVRGNVSSQFLSALLMALPLTGNAYTIEVDGELISKPYIDITLNLLARFGVIIDHQNYQAFKLPAHAVYTAPDHLSVEGDASGASYFLAAGLLGGAPVRVEGIDETSIQGDIAFAKVMADLGGHVVWGDGYIEVSRSSTQRIPAFDIDANHIPDAAMTLAVVALAAEGTSTIRNIASWRVKETDRIDAMACELRKLGAEVSTTPDSIRIIPPAHLNENIAIDTYDDHRMAMCFSLVSLLGVPVIINDPQCVNKTFPDYFVCFERIASDTSTLSK